MFFFLFYIFLSISSWVHKPVWYANITWVIFWNFKFWWKYPFEKMNLHLLYETVMVRFDDVVEQQAIFIKYLCKNIYVNCTSSNTSFLQKPRILHYVILIFIQCVNSWRFWDMSCLNVGSWYFSYQVHECGWVSRRIDEIISQSDEKGQEISSFEFIPQDFFQDLESSWKGRVKRIHAMEAFEEVDKAAEALSTAVSCYKSQPLCWSWWISLVSASGILV